MPGMEPVRKISKGTSSAEISVDGIAHEARRASKAKLRVTRMTPNGEAERPHDRARLAPRAHTVFQRSRRVPTGVSRPAPAIVRPQPTANHASPEGMTRALPEPRQEETRGRQLSQRPE